MTMEPYVQRQRNTPIQHLPEAIRALFDAAQPIPPDVWFQPRSADMNIFVPDLISGGLFAGGLTSCLGTCLLVALIGSLLDGVQKTGDIWGVLAVAIVFLLFFGLVVAGLIAFWRPLWYEWLAVQEQRKGMLRRGLFLTPEAMVVRLKTNRCDVIPRDSIAQLGFVGGRRHEWRIYCHAPVGARTDPYGYIEYSLDFPPFNRRDPEPMGISKIREWAKESLVND